MTNAPLRRVLWGSVGVYALALVAIAVEMRAGKIPGFVAAALAALACAGIVGFWPTRELRQL